MILLLKYSFILLLNQKISHFLSGNTGLGLEPELEPEPELELELELEPKLWTKVEPKRSRSRKKIILAPQHWKIVLYNPKY